MLLFIANPRAGMSEAIRRFASIDFPRFTVSKLSEM
jgi:hypothetical protein